VIINRGKIVAAGTPAELRERVADESRLIAEIQAPQDAARAALGALPEISDPRFEDQDGWLRVSVAAKGDQRETLARLARDQNWPLRELRREVASLEDFFVNIVAGAR
jgi:ABC-type multidrug transport system ATPase subunit